METKDRCFRNMELRIASDEKESYKVEGYASTFEPYVLFEDKEEKYIEVIEKDAFEGTDLSDVVYRIDHEGAVYARTSAGTLEVNADDHGLHMIADLSKSANARNHFEDVKAGNYPQMSFAFKVAEDTWLEERTEDGQYIYTRTIKRVSKVYDVSPVSFPANPTTELDVSTRSAFDGAIEGFRAERLKKEKRQKDLDRLTLKLKLMEVK